MSSHHHDHWSSARCVVSAPTRRSDALPTEPPRHPGIMVFSGAPNVSSHHHDQWSSAGCVLFQLQHAVLPQLEAGGEAHPGIMVFQASEPKVPSS